MEISWNCVNNEVGLAHFLEEIKVSILKTLFRVQTVKIILNLVRTHFSNQIELEFSKDTSECSNWI